MKILRKAQAGSLESSDLMVFIEPSSHKEIILESTVEKQYKKKILAIVNDIIKEQRLSGGFRLHIHDNGALEPTIRARITTCILRGSKK